MTNEQPTKAGKRSGHISIDAERCKGCHLCIPACPRGLIEVSDCLNLGGNYPARPKQEDGCTACGMCWQVCPDVAIEVYRETKDTTE